MSMSDDVAKTTKVNQEVLEELSRVIHTAERPSTWFQHSWNIARLFELVDWN